MTASRKKPGVAFWATVVVVLELVYVLSFGPAIGMSERIDNDVFLACCDWVYVPIAWLYLNGPEPLHDLISWWVNLWMP